jgi:hypothetical protein
MSVRMIMSFTIGFGLLLLTFFIFNQIPVTRNLVQRALK